MSIRAVVVDDEPLARDRMVHLLRQEADVEIVAVCGDGREACDQVRATRPDLLLLDMRMPEMDGLQVLETLGPHAPPAVIFVTAYDRYAIQAFEVNALDYLLKPYDRERFARAVARARERLAAKEPLAGRLADMLSTLRPTSVPERLVLRTDERTVFLRVGDVDWVESAGNYVVVHSGSETWIERSTMAEMLERLPAERFERVHRSAIVNLERVREVRAATPRARSALVLNDGTELPLSRRLEERVLERLGG